MAHSSVYARNMKRKSYEDPVLTVKQVAERLNCSIRHVYDLVKDERLKSFKVGDEKGIRIFESDISKIMGEQTI